MARHHQRRQEPGGPAAPRSDSVRAFVAQGHVHGSHPAIVVLRIKADFVPLAQNIATSQLGDVAEHISAAWSSEAIAVVTTPYARGKGTKQWNNPTFTLLSALEPKILGFRVQGLGLRVSGSGFRVQGSGFWV